ncbi:hypothetical protein HMPREF9103_03030 [Lentilactobacillus parafarraginis F0439]|uniref:Uncharacterized protein n=1 Tax=Lentilactobacillus parafarraginis F0439 TaxID=797515 RepID=G9ZTE5_9LACO|nr:hypothetical protein [Lentilactobacillus parafarraginis]EHL95360.1 hypothetical protein HMPREF9103_03030 [Lentilactobacillus parafarraginis F0439]
MKRIKDERLIIRNLENVRWAFGIENLAALAILASELINRRPWNAILSLKNPAFLLVFIGSMVLVVLSLNVTGPIEGGKRKLSTWFLIMAFLLEWLFWGAFFWMALAFSQVLLSAICGLIPALVMTGSTLYINRFREAE